LALTVTPQGADDHRLLVYVAPGAVGVKDVHVAALASLPYNIRQATGWLGMTMLIVVLDVGTLWPAQRQTCASTSATLGCAAQPACPTALQAW
jgi:hypothetical protein